MSFVKNEAQYFCKVSFIGGVEVGITGGGKRDAIANVFTGICNAIQESSMCAIVVRVIACRQLLGMVGATLDCIWG